MTFGSLFSGIGGLDLGLERAGMRCVWQVEIDHYARRVLAKHWPGVRRWDDVQTFPPEGDWSCDLIAGGFPCKQTSTGAAIHGYRSGLVGKDSGLWFEMLRIVRLFRPKWVVVENVGGVSKWKTAIQEGLADAGYRVPGRPLEVPAASLGAPYSRRRLFWVANADGKRLEIAWQGGPSPSETRQRRAVARNAWVANLAGTWRVDAGAAGGLDRRKRIELTGNAVAVPVAEWIGRRIMEYASGATSS